jgi:hypothetical protein
LTRTAISRVEIMSVSPLPVALEATCTGTAITLRLAPGKRVVSGETLTRMIPGAYHCSAIRRCWTSIRYDVSCAQTRVARRRHRRGRCIRTPGLEGMVSNAPDVEGEKTANAGATGNADVHCGGASY